MPNSHLVIFKKPYLEAILAGTKSVESRLNKTNRPPFNQVSKGDKLFLKESSGPVRATAKAVKVKQFETLCRYKTARLKQEYNHLIKGSDEYWQSKAHCVFGTLIWLEEVKQIKPVRINKKDWRAWVVLTQEKNYGLLR